MVNEYLGGLAGAALGFIHNDVPGAYAGWQVGRKAARAGYGHKLGAKIVRFGKKVLYPKKKMTPIPPVTPSSSRDFEMYTGRGRSSSRNRTPTRASSKASTKRSRTSTSRTRSVSRGRGKKVRLESINQGNSTRKKSVKKNTKEVKVSPVFRKKVKQALESKALKGVHTNIGYGYVSVPNSNQQEIHPGTWQGSSDQGVHFTPFAVSNAAAELWRNKTPTIDPFAGTASDYNLNNAVIKVENSYVDITYANMSHRTAYFTIYECLYKSNRIGGEVPNAATYWRKCLVDDVTAGIAKAGNNAYDGIVTPAVEMLHATPGETSAFSKMFKYTTRKVILEPGQKLTHTVQGPKNTIYDFSKFYVNNIVTNYPANKAVSVFIVMHTDLVMNSLTAGSGRYLMFPSFGTTGDNNGHVVATEYKATFVLEVPEQTGFQNPATFVAGAVQDLNLKKRAFLRNVWTFGLNAASGDINKIDPNQPATDI